MLRHMLGGCSLLVLVLALWRLAPRAWHAIDAARQAPTAAPNPEVSPPIAGPALHVLFIGNSHTAVNDLPRLISQLAKGAAVHDPKLLPLDYLMDTPSGATLADHLRDGRVPAHLHSGHFDYVVLQDQQQRPAWKDQAQVEREFFAPARTLDVIIRAAQSKTLLYMTPARQAGDYTNVPDDTYERMQDRTRDSYLKLARELDVNVVPAGLAWRWAHEQEPSLALWQSDGYHPSLVGSYLTACTFFGVLYARSPEDNPFLAGLPQDQARFLQHAAEVARHML